MTRAPGFGVAIRNFCPSPEALSIDGIVDYGTRAAALGLDSAWVWDHILLGTRRPFPFLDSLSTLAALAMRTTRLRLGTGVLVLPLRNPVVLAKVLASVDQISKGRLILGVAAGWYEREFEACGVPFRGRGKTFVRNLEILTRLWTEEQVTGSVDGYVFNRAVMLPKPAQRPRPPILVGGYVEAVLRRIARHGDGWLTYFYTPESFRKAWARAQERVHPRQRDPRDAGAVRRTAGRAPGGRRGAHRLRAVRVPAGPARGDRARRPATPAARRHAGARVSRGARPWRRSRSSRRAAGWRRRRGRCATSGWPQRTPRASCGTATTSRSVAACTPAPRCFCYGRCCGTAAATSCSPGT